MAWTLLGNATWGTAPDIGVRFRYEKQRVGNDMQYRIEVRIDPVSGASYFGYPIYALFSLEGKSMGSVTIKESIPYQWTNYITYVSNWFTVANKTSGTTAVGVRLYSGSGEARVVNYSYTAAVDPVATVISASNGTLGQEMSISLTRYDNNYRDTITYTCGTESGTIVEKTALNTVKWTPSVHLSAQSTSGGAVSIKLTVTTYNGNTVVGTNNKSVQCQLPSGNLPTCKLEIGDQMGFTEIYGNFVQGLSKFSIVVEGTPNATSKAPIMHYSVNVRTVIYDSYDRDGSAMFVTDVIPWSGTVNIIATVTDSHGKTASDTMTVTVLPYSLPTAALNCRRCDQDGTANDEGAYISATYNGGIASLNGLNSGIYHLRYKKSSQSSYTSVKVGASGTYIFAADTGSTYDVLYYVEDDLGNVATRSQGIGTAFTIMHIRADGTGVAFGKVSEKQKVVELGIPIYANNGVFDRNELEIRNGLAYYASGGAVDCNTTLEELVLSTTNTPTSSFWFVRTMFYAQKSATANRTQIAMPYAGGAGLYYRTYNGSWSNWETFQVVAESGTSGIWTYRKYADGSLEMEGVYSVSDVACNTALGSMYRTAVIQPNAFPFTVTNPKLTASYESAGYGAFYWATTATTTTNPPSFYLVRPTSTTISSGKVVFRVSGKWK